MKRSAVAKYRSHLLIGGVMLAWFLWLRRFEFRQTHLEDALYTNAPRRSYGADDEVADERSISAAADADDYTERQSSDKPIPMQKSLRDDEDDDEDDVSRPKREETTNKRTSTETDSPLAKCPNNAKVIRLLFPHVNKAGGRTIEGTFSTRGEVRFRHLTKARRSYHPSLSYELVDGHKDFDEILQISRCPPDRKLGCRPNGDAVSPNNNNNMVCNRWIFMMREPFARTLSAFYTTVGRGGGSLLGGGNGNDDDEEEEEDGNAESEDEDKQDDARRFRRVLRGTVDHFRCAPNSIVAKRMLDPTFTFAQFAALPLEERKKCDAGVANLHTRYLVGEGNLEKAKRRLTQMSWVGLAEHFALSMRLLDWDLNLRLERYTPVYNDNAYPSRNLTHAEKEALLELNRLDLQLYEYASKELFWPRVSAMERALGMRSLLASDLAACDSVVVCWDKRKPGAGGPTTDAKWIKSGGLAGDDEQMLLAAPHTYKPGEMKRNVLCAPRDGCLLRRDKDSRSTSSTTTELLPPPLAARPETKCVPSFFIVGARKGGTTSLYQYLSAHPNVWGVLLNRDAQSGETFFLERHAASVVVSKSATAIALRRDLNSYFLDLMSREAAAQRAMGHKTTTTMAFSREHYLTGESSVGNGPHCAVPRALKAACGGDVRVIYLVRDPLERMLSQHLMRERLGTVDPAVRDPSFEGEVRRFLRDIRERDAEGGGRLKNWLNSEFGEGGGGEKPSSMVTEEEEEEEDVTATRTTNELPARLASSSPPCLYPSDLENPLWSGLYVVHLSRWLRQFDARRIMVIQSESFFKNPASTLRRAYRFLGLAEDAVDVQTVTRVAFNTALSPPRLVKTKDPSSRRRVASPRNDNNNNNKGKLAYENDNETLSESLREEVLSYFRPFNLALKRMYPETIDLELWQTPGRVSKGK